MHSIPGPVSADSTLKICKGQEVHFQSQSSKTDLAEWLFSDDASEASGLETSHRFNLPGTFPVTLIAKSLCACADTTFMLVEVLDSPSPTLNCVSAVCPGSVVTYSTPDACGDLVWSVSPNGVISGGGGMADDSITVQWMDGANSSIGLSLRNCSGSECPVETVFSVPVVSNAAEITGNATPCRNLKKFTA